jgi:hypothetical protein
MTVHLCCPACRVRFGPGSVPGHDACPRCGDALVAVAPRDAMGYTLCAATHREWAPANLDALAHAVADVIAIPHQPR